MIFQKVGPGKFKKFTHLACHEMKCSWLIFKTKLLIFQSKANLDENILFGKITHHLVPEVRKMLVRGMFWKHNSTFHSGS